MKKNIQTRREFFKKAAKGTLPILGAVLLTQFPIASQAFGRIQMGCNATCEGGCKTLCEEGCSHTCNNSGCKGSCDTRCNDSCKGSATTRWK